ncbi:MULTISPECIES: ankyrin repeat domain-containing protein [Aquimarina]|uniref:ankyrin repeat domain-containing protein n=1 Tax=Aquimarina TaxID=290174 RepID=UPI000D6913C8|nr:MULTISPECIES: ankyrin repeat domain-containing protein [Aquimarina]
MGKGGRPIKVAPELEYLDHYIKDNDIQGITNLINEFGVDCFDTYKRTLLINAAAKGNVEILKLLIDKEADINFQDKIGYTALHFAAQNKNIEIASTLVEHGADINSKDNYGNPPIWTAIFNAKGDYNIVELLLKTGADIDTKNKNEKSPREMGELMLGDTFVQLLKVN